jgi:mannose-1-phosphate guanylyltransferase
MQIVIMAGGKGTRFWPQSRESKPKQFLSILGPETMVQQTVKRVLPLCGYEKIWVVTGKDQAHWVNEQVPRIPPHQILVEPVGRNTAPCIGWAALELSARDPGEPMVVLPSDHLILNEALFRKTMALSAQAAVKADRLLTIGIPPAAPETGYGYLEKGETLTPEFPGLFKVQAFHEKPSRGKALRYLKAGNTYWNSGMFIFTPRLILSEIARYLPKLHRALGTLKKHREKPGYAQTLDRIFKRLAPISIDYGVMEKSNRVVMMEGHFGWNDLGSWEALYQVRPKDKVGNAGGGDLLSIEARGNLVLAPNKLVALVGVENLVVVETGDALLIARRESVQEVKKVVEAIKRQGKKYNKYL